MINKWIQFTVAAENAPAFAITMKNLVKESQREEGCIHYSAFQSEDDHTLFTVLEQWADKEAFEKHRLAPHTQSFKDQWGNKILNKTALSLNAI